MLKKKLKLEEAATTYLKGAFARPEPRLKEGRLLVEQGVKCGIDISDGLLADLGHICQASGVGARLETERLPIRAEVKSAFGAGSLEMALSGGEDYQLLFSAQPAVVEKVQEASEYPVTVIGEVFAGSSGAIEVIDRKGQPYRTRETGWDHFKSR